MKVFRLIIAGGRDFDDFKKLCMVCDHMLSRVIEEGYKITVVCGMAKGADTLGEKYAKKRGFDIAYFPAGWNKYGKKAGYLRNQQMLDYARGTEGACIAFWDGKSRGTKNMIDLCNKYDLRLHISRY
jgi:hypothetical protein